MVAVQALCLRLCLTMPDAAMGHDTPVCGDVLVEMLFACIYNPCPPFALVHILHQNKPCL